jgi:phosphatidate cytidylyltransferase
MTDEGPLDPENKRSDPPSEGVRIIGAEEAAEALERGDVAPRRGGDQPRYGDRPTPPAADGPRPVLRFPLGSSSDPRDIERSPVAEPISEPVELPHWTEPPTGQVPQILPDLPRDEQDDWSSFATSTPRWRDDSDALDEHEGFEDMHEWDEEPDAAPPRGALDDRDRPTHDDYFTFADLDDTATTSRSVFADVPDIEEGFGPGWAEEAEEEVQEPVVARPPERPRRAPADEGYRAQRSARPPRGGDRDMGMAVIVGVGFLAVALVLFNIGPAAAMVLVTAIVGLGVAELFGVLRKVGYEPVTLVGIVGTVGLVLGAYNNGTAAVPTVLFLTTAVCLLWYLVGAAHQSPVMNVGVTLLGVLWVGLFGSFAALMLALPPAGGLEDPGTGILLAAIFGTVGYDVGGLFIGRNAGRQPLSSASPNKTVEGLIGGCVVAALVVAIGSVPGFGPIDRFSEGLLVGVAVALSAPLGDLCQSLVKRDLGVKDMGALLPGHGGLLDRFDSLLFVLPTVYLLASVRDFFV